MLYFNFLNDSYNERNVLALFKIRPAIFSEQAPWAYLVANQTTEL
jgi:hypothetical protein